MTLVQEFNAAQDGTFIQRVQVAGVAFAVNIIQHEDSTTTNHRNRVAYALNFVRSPGTFAPALALGVTALTSAIDGSSLDDTQVSNAVAAIWDMYAGI